MIGGDRMLEPMHVGDKVAGLSYLLPLLIPHQPLLVCPTISCPDIR